MGDTFFSKVKNALRLDIYSIFSKNFGKKSDRGSKGRVKGIIGVVGLNICTAGLVNIFWRIQQERRYAKQGKSRPVETHNVGIERKISFLTNLVKSQYANYDGLYPEFSKALDCYLREVFKMPQTQTVLPELDDTFYKALEVATEIEQLKPKFEAIGEEARNMGIIS